MSSGPASDVSPGRGLIEAFGKLPCVIRARMFITHFFDGPSLVESGALTGAAKEDDKTL
jgi:hypothetical protein